MAVSGDFEYLVMRYGMANTSCVSFGMLHSIGYFEMVQFPRITACQERPQETKDQLFIFFKYIFFYYSRKLWRLKAHFWGRSLIGRAVLCYIILFHAILALNINEWLMDTDAVVSNLYSAHGTLSFTDATSNSKTTAFIIYNSCPVIQQPPAAINISGQGCERFLLPKIWNLHLAPYWGVKTKVTSF